MKSGTKKVWLITAAVCIVLLTAGYFAGKIPFYLFGEQVFETSVSRWFTIDHLRAFIPVILIIALSSAGIALCKALRNRLLEDSRELQGQMQARGEKAKGSIQNHGFSKFMTVRWIFMIGSFFFMVYGGLLMGLRFANVSIPAFFCPWNTQQLTETSCYFLSHLSSLFELPVWSIVVFFVSTVGIAVFFGRMICGFFCPLGLVQDLMDTVRQKQKTEGISMTEEMYHRMVPVRWTMVFFFLGISFAGGDFCLFCPAMTLSPAFAGLAINLYLSGFIMILVLIAGYFKRRAFCNICPLGYLLGLSHKISPFRLKKDCQACTECGACYEACPMGVKQIYTEREKSDVTDTACIMCGECIRKCPEDNALSMTFAGHAFYSASRTSVLAGYRKSVIKVQRRAGRQKKENKI